MKYLKIRAEGQILVKLTENVSDSTAYPRDFMTILYSEFLSFTHTRND